MHIRMANNEMDVYRTKLLKDGEKLDTLLDYIPKKGEHYKDGVFVKGDKIVRSSIAVSDPIWAVIDPILGRTEDENIAWFFGIPTPFIVSRRKALRILPFGFFQWETIDPLFKLGTDKEVSELFCGDMGEYELSIRRNFLESPRNELEDSPNKDFAQN